MNFDTCFRIVGKCDGERRIVRCAAAAFAAYCQCDQRAGIDRESYLPLAARNMAGAGCGPNAIHGLLTDTALDTGLPPAEVRRQIDCGIADALKAGAAA